MGLSTDVQTIHNPNAFSAFDKPHPIRQRQRHHIHLTNFRVYTNDMNGKQLELTNGLSVRAPIPSAFASHLASNSRNCGSERIKFGFLVGRCSNQIPDFVIVATPIQFIATPRFLSHSMRRNEALSFSIFLVAQRLRQLRKFLNAKQYEWQFFGRVFEAFNRKSIRRTLTHALNKTEEILINLLANEAIPTEKERKKEINEIIY